MKRLSELDSEEIIDAVAACVLLALSGVSLLLGVIVAVKNGSALMGAFVVAFGIAIAHLVAITIFSVDMLFYCWYND